MVRWCRSLAWLSCCVAGGANAAVVGPMPGSAIDGSLPATVMEVNPSGVGHINLVPYYTVRSGFDTYVNIVNTDTRNGKAVKVRFRAGLDGQDIGNFTVLLGPGDKWAAALTRDAATGYPRVAHNDRSCTLPADVKVTLGPTYGKTLEWGQLVEAVGIALEGTVEIIVLADIPRLINTVEVSPLFSATATPAGWVGPSCEAIALDSLAVDSGSYADARAKGLEVPTTGLMTQWTLINVPRAVAYTGRATALEARVAAGGLPGYGNVVLFPQTKTLVQDAVRTAAYTTDPRLRGWAADNQDGVFSPLVVTNTSYFEHWFPDLSTPYLQAGLANMAQGIAARRQAHGISKALAVASVESEFVTEPAILAKTDWVLTMPTRYLEAALRPTQIGGPSNWTLTNLTMDDTGLPVGGGVRNYFVRGGNMFNYVCVAGMDPFVTGKPTAPPQSETSFRTHEGWAFNMQPDSNFPTPFALCGQTNVLRFAKATDALTDGALGDALERRLISNQSAGWGRIQIPGVSGRGLPIIGFAVSELYNAAVSPGVAGVFGQTFPLGTTKPVP